MPLLGYCQAPDFDWEAPWAEGAEETKAPPLHKRLWAPEHPVSKPRTYTGEHLEYVLMPIGGIGTGTIWLDGQGRLAVWQIFNNYDERDLGDSFFAIRARQEGAQAVTRILQTTGEAGLDAMDSLEYEGGYPIARLRFSEPDLPVEVMLEGYNPMIPTDAANSALPCAVFRITASNRTAQPVQVDVLGTVKNALATMGQAGVVVGNRAVVEPVRESNLAAAFMHYTEGPLGSGTLVMRPGGERRGEKVEVLWMRRVTGPAEISGAGEEQMQLLQRFAEVVNTGGAVVAAGADPSFFKSLDAVKQLDAWHRFMKVFEDFEGDDYEGWTIEGGGFGDGPADGTLAGQQEVSGFVGQGLVNTFLDGDTPQGRMVSDAFTIRSQWIGFLIGGGQYEGETCMNLVVDGEPVRTATGKNQEKLELQSWNVSDLMGQEARLEIVDRRSGGWGHVNVDHIFFSDTEPTALSDMNSAYRTLAEALRWPTNASVSAQAAEGTVARVTGDVLAGVTEPWQISTYTRIPGLAEIGDPYEVLAETPSGDPLIIAGPVGEANAAICLAGGLPWEWALRLMEEVTGEPVGEGARLQPSSPSYGSMALSCPDGGAIVQPVADLDALVEQFKGSGSAGLDGGVARSDAKNGAVIVPMRLGAGEAKTVSFAITWHFPVVERLGGHFGNLYNRAFASAMDVAQYVNSNIDALWQNTRLYHTSLYQSNLPPEVLDAISSQSVIVRGPTAWWAEDGYFGAFEGCYGCCPLNCTHVWNYAQTHARLFPTVGRNMRQSDLLVYLHEDGETSHRQHRRHGAFIDGQAATILDAYREYQMSADDDFLASVWPEVRKATDWLIGKIDEDEDGVPAGHQLNTYDCAVSGANTFIGSQYLAALAAAEQMAKVMGDGGSAQRWADIRSAGMENQDTRLWNEEYGYYIQKPGAEPARDYNTGCHSDQLLGQWWAHQLNLGYLYPPERVERALSAVIEHNFREDFHGFQQRPRRFVVDDDSGLLMCTWPHGGRPQPNIIYADEVWTGIEYSTAGAMIYEGMIDEARQIVRAARARYDGKRRDGLNSGPGGNPFCELECGKFYARAMSSWGMLIAAQGLVLEGPKGIIGFKPNWRPEDHRSFFTAPEGWGLFVQSQDGARQTERIEVRYGVLRVKELVFEVPAGVDEGVRARVSVGEQVVPASMKMNGREVRIGLGEAVSVSSGNVITVELTWGG